MGRRLTLAFAALALCMSASIAFAQGGFPNRPIRLLVGFPPGGSTDVLARALAQEARTGLGQEVVVVNRPGASGAIAVNEVIAAVPDGHTIGICPSSTFTLAFHFADIRPDLLDRVEPLLMVGRQRVGMVVRADSPHKTLKELVAFARKNPGKVSIGIPGTGTSVEIFSREIMRQGGAEAVFVPFKGDSGVTTALLGGQIVAGSFSTGGFAQQVKAGKMRVIASYQEDRLEMAPDVPTLEERGYGLRGTTIQFMFGPKGMPPAAMKRLVAEFAKAAQSKVYINVARNNDLYDRNLLAHDTLNAYLLRERVLNAVLIERLGMKKQQ